MIPNRYRSLAVAAALVCAAGSCGPQEADAPEGRDPASDGSALLDRLERDLPEPGRGEQPPEGAGAPRVHARSEPTSPGEEAPPEPALRGPNDFVGTGMMAPFYLRASTPKLVVEINAVSGWSPSPSAIDLLRTRLASVADKPGGIEILAPKAIPGGRSSYSLEDIRELEQRHRARFSTNDEVTMHVLYLNGRMTDAAALGLAYTGSAVAVFAEQIERASTPLVPAERIEQAVLVHEIGHLLSLVNLVYKSPRDHEDPEHPGHSKHRSSVMYWAVESLSVASVLTGGPPTDFSADDRADLEDVKAGRLMGSS